MGRVTFVGAGSVEFTRGVLADLMTATDMAPLDIVLHDIDPDRLATAERAARITAQLTGHPEASVTAEVDRRAALDGADYVVNEIQVGGLEATLRDFEIPARHGLRQTIADTLGIGGIFRGLRTLPVMIGIGDDMAEVCPDAWLLNYTNPMAMVPWAVYQGSRKGERVVGLCHSVRDTHEHLAGLVGVPVEECEFLTAGFNHQAFVLRFGRGDQDLYPLLRRALDADPDQARRVRVEIFRRFGYFPTESSEHSSEYVPWFIRRDELIERYRIPVDEYVRRSRENLEIYDETRRQISGEEPFVVEPAHELASEVIHSMETGTPRVVYGNVRNDALIDNLPEGCCVEVPCDVDATGLRPRPVGRLPAQLAALNRTFLNVVELTVLAVLEGRRDHVYHAAYLDPNAAATLTLDEIRLVCDELIAAHGDLMPEAIRRG